jgi:hypothetical protein
LNQDSDHNPDNLKYRRLYRFLAASQVLQFLPHLKPPAQHEGDNSKVLFGYTHHLACCLEQKSESRNNNPPQIHGEDVDEVVDAAVCLNISIDGEGLAAMELADTFARQRRKVARVWTSWFMVDMVDK